MKGSSFMEGLEGDRKDLKAQWYDYDTYWPTIYRQGLLYGAFAKEINQKTDLLS